MNPTLPQPIDRVNGHPLQHRHSSDFRRASSGAMPVNGHAPMPLPHPRMGSMGNGMRSFDGPRSPPNSKNTSHVPCKFFRQGTCQAGKACPFAHSEDAGVCKYFQKGNCKFGMRCANEHITSDGRRINKPAVLAMGPGPVPFGGRTMPTPIPPPAGSLLSMQQNHLTQGTTMPGGPDDFSGPGSWNKRPPYDIPTIDTTFSSHPGSAYGSPPDGRLPLSPVQKGLSVLDAPLPASFDSQGISFYARTGPVAASVPARFGMESSPPSSLPSKPIGESTALRNLHNSAFGDDSRHDKSSLASSPPAAADEPVGRRIMHSERWSRPKMMSASLGARPPLSVNDEWDENFAFEEDMLPNSLHDLLTPQEKLRRFSRNAEEENRLSLSGLGTPAESSSKVGSPSTASPSRFGALFSRQKMENSEAGAAPGASAFGHVGSPLRNSSLHPGASPSLRPISKPTSGDISPFVSSPPRQASMSMITQQLQRTRLSNRVAESSPDAPVHPGMIRVASGSSSGSTGPGRLDRAVSGSSVGRERIEEEQELFSMDDDPDMKKKKTNWKRSSGGLWTLGKASPRLGPIGGQRGSSGTQAT